MNCRMRSPPSVNRDENTWDLGVGPAKIGGSGTGLVDEERQLLFFSDNGNSRVLVWDIDPQRLETGMDAIAVIGQPDFYTREAGTGARGLSSPSGLAYDPSRQNLFVVDRNRVMAFDVSDQSLAQVAGFEAFAAIGQADFESNEPNEDLRKFSNGPISLDYEFNRLLVGSFTKNRVLMFDVSPARLEGASNPDAIAVLGQPDFESTDPAVSQTRLTMARVTVDTERQMAYVPDGLPGGKSHQYLRYSSRAHAANAHADDQPNRSTSTRTAKRISCLALPTTGLRPAAGRRVGT